MQHVEARYQLKDQKRNFELASFKKMVNLNIYLSSNECRRLAIMNIYNFQLRFLLEKQRRKLIEFNSYLDALYSSIVALK